MRTKEERKERVKLLTNEWLIQTLEAIRDGKSSGRELQTRFIQFCSNKGIGKPQDKSLRNLVVARATIELKQLSRAVRESKAGL